MQVHRTPVLINGDSGTLTVTVGAGGPGIYYGSSSVNLEGQSTAAPGSSFTITSPTYVKTQGGRDESSDISLLSAGPQVGSSVVESVNAVAAAGAAQTLPEPSVATVHRLVLTAAMLTLTFPTAAPGKSFTVVLVQDATGGRLVTWPGTVKWAGGTAPVLTATANKADTVSFLCADGTNWLGFVAGIAF